MRTRHICVINTKSGGVAWATGDTEAQAEKIAREQISSRTKIHTLNRYTQNVPDGQMLVVRPQVGGISWWTETEADEPAYKALTRLDNEARKEAGR